jgi:excisionase family DNA binding protein
MADVSDIPEVMDIQQASQYLGVSRETLYKYLNEERIPAFKLGNRWRLKKTVLDRWMETESTRRESPQRGHKRENPG